LVFLDVDEGYIPKCDHSVATVGVADGSMEKVLKYFIKKDDEASFREDGTQIKQLKCYLEKMQNKFVFRK